MELLKDIADYKCYQNFKELGLPILLRNLSAFFNSDVKVIEHPVKTLKTKYNYDISQEPDRKCYFLDELTILICHINTNEEVKAFIAFEIKSEILSRNSRGYLYYFAESIGDTLSEGFKEKFRNSYLYFNDKFLTDTIASYLGKADKSNIIFLISLLDKLRGITFENETFTTGFIFSRAIPDYKNDIRNGEIVTSNKTIRLISDPNSINKRIWFIVDGKNTFYLVNKNLNIKNIFISNPENTALSYLDSYTLSKTLKGRDIAFRVISNNQYSILNSAQIEFINIENEWKIRDYKSIKQLFKEVMSLSEQLIESLLFYILYCSQNNKSAIIWIPEIIEDIDKLIFHKNKITMKNFSINDYNKAALIFRCLASDGVTIIDKDGLIMYYGCIVNLTDIIPQSGFLGTGEKAASILSENGLSIKISSDGQIKIFIKNSKKPILF